MTFHLDFQAAKEPAPSAQDGTKKPFNNRRVVLQRKITAKGTEKTEKSVYARIEIKNDPTQPNPGIFSRAVRTAIGNDKNRIVVKKVEDTTVEYDSEGSEEERLLSEENDCVAMVTNLPHGMTDTRLKTLAGNDVQVMIFEAFPKARQMAWKLVFDSFSVRFVVV